MNGLHELPLIIFTVLAQSVVGAFLFISIALSRTSLMCSCRSRAYKGIFVLLALLGIGFMASIAHLGSPLRAFNALNRVGESMLSNEIAAGGAFFAVVGIYWLLGVLFRLTKTLDKALLALGAIIGLVFMFVMNQVYHINTVPTWDNIFTSANFYLTVLIGGLSLVFALMYHESPKAKANLGKMPFIVMSLVFVSAIFAIYQGFALGDMSNSILSARDLVPDFAHLTAENEKDNRPFKP